MKRLFIFPYNGNCIEAIDCIGNQYELVGIIDDTSEKQGKSEYGYMVYPREELLKNKENFILAIPGSPTSYSHRAKIISGLNVSSEKFATVIHPSAIVSPMAKIGKNVLIMAGVVITSNAVIEDHVCILPNTVVHHDVVIKKYTLIGSNVSIAGHTQVGENCYIGSGTRIINNIVIGDKTLVGLGSNVIKSIPAGSKVVGNPARLI